MTGNSMQVFDRNVVRGHRDRAADELGRYDFLFQTGADHLSDRLRDIKRYFPDVLDLGCHNGLTSRTIRNQSGIRQITGADISFAMLQTAQNNGIDHAIMLDAEYLPFAPQSFDMVVSNLSLHWVNDLPGTLVQIKQLLKPDGLFLATLLGGETLYELRQCLMEAELMVTGGVSPRISPMADMADAAGLLQRTGFALPVVDSETLVVDYDNIFALMKDLRGMGETNATLNRSRRPLRRSVLLEAAKIYQEKFSTPEGRIIASFQIIFMIGWAPHESQQQPLRPGSAQHRLADALNTTEYSTGVKAFPKLSSVPTKPAKKEEDK